MSKVVVDGDDNKMTVYGIKKHGADEKNTTASLVGDQFVCPSSLFWCAGCRRCYDGGVFWNNHFLKCPRWLFNEAQGVPSFEPEL